jgi:hypothetical protein
MNVRKKSNIPEIMILVADVAELNLQSEVVEKSPPRFVEGRS